MPSGGNDSSRSKSINGSYTKNRDESFDSDVESRVGKMSLKVVREFIR